MNFKSIVFIFLSLFLIVTTNSIACDGMSASVQSNVYIGNGMYQITIQYCENVSNGAGSNVWGIIVKANGATIAGTTTNSFTSAATGVTINYNTINSSTVQWGEWDNNPSVPVFLPNGNATECFTIVIKTNGIPSSIDISGSSASSNLGGGFTNWNGRYCCKQNISVPTVSCQSNWTPPLVCPTATSPINLNSTTTLTGVFSGAGVNSSNGMFNPVGQTFPVSVTFTVGDNSLNCSTTKQITSPYSITPINDQTICPGQTASLTASASASLPCNYTLRLEDSYGDGWQGAANVKIYINGVLYGTYTCSGSLSTFTLPVSSGDVITMNYTQGSYNSENRIKLLNASGSQLYNQGNPPNGWLGSGITVNCGNNSTFTYSWSPTTGLSNPSSATTTAAPTTTTTYTVSATNTTTGCVLTEPVTINVSSGGAPSFTPINYVCQSATPPVLPATSTDGISGTWSPSTINTATPGTATYNFTPNANQCATPTSMSITTLGAQRIAPLGAQCSVATLNFEALPNPGPSGITYNWTVSSPTGLTANPTSGSASTFTTTVTNSTANPITFSSPDVITITQTIGGVTCTKTFGPTINPTPLISAKTATICSGQAFNITPQNTLPDIVPTSTTYTWTVVDNPNVTGESNQTTGQNSISQTLTNLTTTNQTVTYNVTPTSGASGNCVGPAFTVTVTLSQPVTPTFSPVGPYCQNTAAPALLSTSTNGINGSWTPSISTTSIGTNTYTFTPSSGQCATTQTMSITVVSQIAPTFNALGPFCQGTTAPSLPSTSTNSISGQWNAPLNTSTVGTTTYTFTPNGGQCATTTTLDITVNALITPTFTPVGPYCVGASVANLPTTSSNGITGTWNNQPSSTNAGTFTYTFSPGSNQCATSTQLSTTVHPLPIINAGPDQTICAGSSVTLTGSGANSLFWSGGISNGTPFQPSSTSNYTLTGTDQNNCSNTDIVQITINALPIVDAGPNITLCIGESITLLASGASQYTWSNSVANGSSITPSVGTFLYSVIGVDANGCNDQDSVTILVNPLPTVAGGPDQTICIGQSVILNATGATTLSWDNGIQNNVAFVPSQTLSYTVTGTENGCTNYDLVQVIVNPIPNVNAGNDLTLCEGENATLTATGAVNYQWSNGVTNNVLFTPSIGTTTYTVTGTSAGGCTATDNLTITVSPKPTVNFSPDITEGCVPLTVTFTNLSSNSTNCTWDFGNGSVENGCGTTSVTFNEPGCFDISLFLDNNGCMNQLTIEDMICVYPYPIAEFSPSTSTISELDAVVNFTNESTNATSYFWDFGDGSSSVASNPNNDYAASTPGEITVMLIASSSAGCTDTAYANLQMIEELIFYVPNTFTPDADNYNPEFKPIFYSGTNPLEYSLAIYNRWGQLLFESKNRDFGWNGSYGQNSEVEMCQDGVYTWKISYSHNGKSKVAVGHVNLLR